MGWIRGFPLWSLPIGSVPRLRSLLGGLIASHPLVAGFQGFFKGRTIKAGFVVSLAPGYIVLRFALGLVSILQPSTQRRAKFAS
ncbi:MAG: hypothetical protein M1281_13405 [Chloroflexi bacterium]|nr:hypothetical protein [Chloroflexota bacterium]